MDLVSIFNGLFISYIFLRKDSDKKTHNNAIIYKL